MRTSTRRRAAPPNPGPGVRPHVVEALLGHRADLGVAIGLHHGHAVSGLEAVAHRRSPGGGARGGECDAAQVELVVGVGEHVDHRRRELERVHREVGEHGPQRGNGEPGHEQGGPPDPEPERHPHEAGHVAEGVEDDPRRQVGRGRIRPVVAVAGVAGGDAAALGHEVGVGVGDPLGAAGGARREDGDGEVVGVGQRQLGGRPPVAPGVGVAGQHARSGRPRSPRPGRRAWRHRRGRRPPAPRPDRRAGRPRRRAGGCPQRRRPRRRTTRPATPPPSTARWSGSNRPGRPGPTPASRRAAASTAAPRESTWPYDRAAVGYGSCLVDGDEERRRRRHAGPGAAPSRAR